MMRWVLTAALLAGLGMPVAAQSGTTPVPQDIEILWGQKIPMRDGVRLNATVYRVRGQTVPLPVIFTLTPYISDTYHRFAMRAARDGYVFAAVDVRGRGNSEGRFEPFVNEGKDGHDIVEWMARQPWSNGKTAMWGGSYGGTDQWATVKEMPPHLTTIVPVAPAYVGHDFPFEGNIFNTYVIQWLTYTSGATAQSSIFGDMAHWASVARTLHRNHLPFRVLDSLAGNKSTMFQRWLEHPAPDAYWDGVAPTPEQYRKITQPILTITGHYDGDQLGTLMHYRNFLKHATPEARKGIFMVMGPWDHGGTRVPTRNVNGIEFGDNSMVDIAQLHKEWYDWTMKDGPRPSFLKKPVAYYVAGSDVWKYADSLEAIANETRRYYLHSINGRANDVFASGTLSTAAPVASAPDRWVYNPLDTVPYMESATNPWAMSFVDPTPVHQTGGNGLIYHSEPFEEEAEVAGQIKFTAWLSMDVPDTDLWVTLYEVLPDGQTRQLTSSLLRARYRESLRQEKLVTPGAVLPYRFENFPFFARRFTKGSRLRLFIRSPNTIALQKNYNGGGVVANESGKEARTARIALHHDPKYPSVLEIPITR